MLIIIIIILLLYLFIIGILIFGFDKVESVVLKDLEPKTAFTIVVPFRNEAENLTILLHSIDKLNYPRSLFEVVFVDDSSEDQSVTTIENILNTTEIDFRILKNETERQAPKKEAITKAIQHAKYSWIITTDADCTVPKYWLDSFDCFIQNTTPSLLVGPVTYNQNNTFLKHFQLLEFLALQGSTIGGFGIRQPFMCNGANLCYKKELFIDLNGFEGNMQISSGDDVFLLQKALQKNANHIRFLKSTHAIVKTAPQSSFKNLVSQRVRWAAKTSSYENLFGKIIGIIVFSMNGLLVCTPLLVASNFMTLKTLLYTCIIKFGIDFLLLFKSARFFSQEAYLKSYFISCLLYPFFSVYVVFLSVFGGYKWKGRAYRK